MSIIILDDIVDTATQDLIEETLLGSETNWHFARAGAYKKELFPEVSDKQRKSIFTFNHIIFNDSQIKDPKFNLYYQVITNISKRIENFDVHSITNMRAQLQLPINRPPGRGIPHLDKHDNRPYKVCLYYVNDVDGDTVLYKQTASNSTPEDIKAGKLDEAERISPKKGRAIVFDGDIYHRASRPTTDLRCVINYNVFLR
jgi:hypothetical protein